MVKKYENQDRFWNLRLNTSTALFLLSDALRGHVIERREGPQTQKILVVSNTVGYVL